MPKYAKKRDDNEPEIVRTLRGLGVEVHKLNEEDIPDLMVGFRGQWFLLEVKGKGKPLKKGQKDFYDQAEGPVAVVRTSEEALEAIGALRES